MDSAFAWKQFYAAERKRLRRHGLLAMVDEAPTLAQLIGRGFASEIHDFALVDYADVLEAARPSWVAGALVTI
jgi:hypothetical protein